MELFSNISWQSFLSVMFILFIAFNASVVVYFKFIKKKTDNESVKTANVEEDEQQIFDSEDEEILTINNSNENSYDDDIEKIENSEREIEPFKEEEDQNRSNEVLDEKLDKKELPQYDDLEDEEKNRINSFTWNSEEADTPDENGIIFDDRSSIGEDDLRLFLKSISIPENSLTPSERDSLELSNMVSNLVADSKKIFEEIHNIESSNDLPQSETSDPDQFTEGYTPKEDDDTDFFTGGNNTDDNI